MSQKRVTYTIREAVPEDAPGYNAHRRRISDEPYNGITRHAGEYTNTIEDDCQRIKTALQQDTWKILVAVDENNQVIGLCEGLTRDRQSVIHNVGVGIDINAHYRGQGIGTALIKTLIAWAEANPLVHRLELEVFTNNVRAVSLYLKLGFFIEGIRRKAYRKHGQFNDAYMMAILFDREASKVKG